MGSICYSWNDTPFAWMDTPFTWKEGCVIQKIIENVGDGGPSPRVRERLKTLTDDEKQTLIGLFIRLDVDELVFETKVNKNKNTKVKVKLKDVEVLMKEQKNIKVDVTIIKD
jgi:hypothetical protein